MRRKDIVENRIATDLWCYPQKTQYVAIMGRLLCVCKRLNMLLLWVASYHRHV